MTRPISASEISFCEVHTFPNIDDISDGQLFSLSLSNKTTNLTHGLHRFPAKYVPQIPRWAIDNFTSPKDTVLDPFMGSGTTLVESLLSDVTAIGLDVDPLARLIARAKTHVIDPRRVDVLRRELGKLWVSPRQPARLVPPMPDIRNFDHWFGNEQWSDLQMLLSAIEAVAHSTAELEFLLVVFSSTLRWVSNADDQSQKTYVSGTNPKTPPPVEKIFWKFFDRAQSGMAELCAQRSSLSRIGIPADGDAVVIAVEPSSVDLVVTSPPYLDSVDYMYNMMLEYFWLGRYLGVPDRAAFNDLRRRTVGAKNPIDRLSLPGTLRPVLDLDTIAPGRRAAAASYFAMMDRHFSAVSRALKFGATYVLVIGNSQSVTGTVPLHEALLRLASQHGLSLDKVFGYRIRRHYMKFPRAGRGGIILVDWVLVLRKNGIVGTTRSLPIPAIGIKPGEVAH